VNDCAVLGPKSPGSSRSSQPRAIAYLWHAAGSSREALAADYGTRQDQGHGYSPARGAGGPGAILPAGTATTLSEMAHREPPPPIPGSTRGQPISARGAVGTRPLLRGASRTPLAGDGVRVVRAGATGPAPARQRLATSSVWITKASLRSNNRLAVVHDFDHVDRTRGACSPRWKRLRMVGGGCGGWCFENGMTTRESERDLTPQKPRT
jgi:hypothetical protein